MAIGLVLAASLVYLLATIVYGMYLLRFDDRLHRAGVAIVGLGAAHQVAAIVARAATGRMSADAYDGFLALSAVAAIGFLLTQIKRSTPIVGAFLTPVLTMVLYSLHVFDREAQVARSAEVAVVTPIHIAASIIGFLVLGAAAAASALAVIQEYRLKTKRFALVGKSRLPPLTRLESFSHRALIVGFPIYTIGVALGAVWLARDPTPLSRHFVMATFSWAIYAATLQARVGFGWKGRRAALLTLVAFLSALFVVLLSALRLDA